MSESELILRVEILDDDEVVETLELDEDKIKVGKLATSQLHLDDPDVSRIHAVLERRDGGEYQVIDLGSASGTYLNGEKISKATAVDGDDLRFGDTTVRLNVVDLAEERAQAQQGRQTVAAGGEVPEGHIQLEDGTVVEPYTLEGYYDDAGNYIPGYYDEEGAYHYGYGYTADDGSWQGAHGYSDPEGEWVATGAPQGRQKSSTELYTENFFEGEPGKVLEIAHLWSDQVLEVESYKKPKTVLIGGDENNDYVLEDSVLEQPRFPLVVYQENDGYSLNFSPRMEGMVKRQGQQYSLEEVVSSGIATESRHARGGYTIELTRDTSVRLDFGGNTFLVHFAPLPAVAGGTLAVERAPIVYQSISLALHVAFMILVFTLPDGYGQLELYDHDAEDRFAELMQPPEEEEEEELDEDWLDDDDAEDESEAEAPDEDEVEDVDELEIEGEEDMDEEELQEARDREIARDAGALAAFDGDPQQAIGGDAQTALADMDADHSASGVGGLGLAGAGRGGAEGEEGVGRANVGTGGGAGAGDADADLGDRDTINPEVIPDEPETQGALDREIIQRVVRQHRREIQHCYEQQLQRNPDLDGRITMQWTISPAGDVVAASVEETTMNSPEVERCMAQRIQRWSFPEPDGGGIVRVNYPFNFSA